MLVPPEKNSASTTLIRLPPRISFVVTSTGVWMFGSRNMSTVSRAGTNSGAPCCSSIDVGQQADDDATVHRVRVPWAVRDWIGDEGVFAFGEEGLVCHGRGT